LAIFVEKIGMRARARVRGFGLKSSQAKEWLRQNLFCLCNLWSFPYMKLEYSVKVPNYSEQSACCDYYLLPLQRNVFISNKVINNGKQTEYDNKR
jgi:hypothetical protein